MTEIERILNDAMALPNINNGNPLCHNDDLCRHRIVILLEVVNDAAPWYGGPDLSLYWGPKFQQDWSWSKNSPKFIS